MALLSILALASTVGIHDCAPGRSLFAINSLYVEPMNLKGSDPFRIHLRYAVPDGLLIKNGTAQYSVTYNYIPFPPIYMPLCDIVTCPIKPGIYTNQTMNKWPWGIRESISTQINWLDENRALLLCLTITGRAIW